MKFNNEVFRTGGINPNRWVTEDIGGNYYVIARYKYKPETGYCKPYYKSYIYPGGNELESNADYSTFKKAVNSCVKYNNLNKGNV